MIPARAAGGRAHLERLREAAERAGFDGLARTGYLLRLAEIASAEGDLDAWRSALERAVEQGLLVGKERVWSALGRGALALEEGRLGDADALLDDIDPEPGVRALWWAHRLARAAAGRDPATAAAALAEVADAGFGDYPGGPPPSELVIEPILQAVRAGAPAAAIAAFGRQTAERLAPGHPDLAELVEALVAVAGGDHSQAADAIGVLDRVGELLTAPTEAMVRVTLARSLAVTGNLDDALEQCGRAEQLLARWAGWRVNEVWALRRRLEGAAGAAPTDGPLTLREQEVVALIAEGLTNGEIARRLYISPKTASVHVSHILAKLGLASRAEAAAWAARTGVARLTPEG